MKRFACSAVLIALVISAPAEAQVDRLTRGSYLPGASLVAPRGAFAVETSPASLAWTEGWDVEYALSFDEGHLQHALYGAAALPLIPLAIGGSLDLDRENEFVRTGRLSLAAAWAFGTHLAVGGALRFQVPFASPSSGATSVDLGVAWRPSPYFAVDITAYDVLGPAGLTTASQDIPLTLSAAAQLRPFGTRRLVFEANVAAATDGRIGWGGLVGLEVPRVGRLWANTQASRDPGFSNDIAFAVQAGIDVQMGTAELRGGFGTEWASVGARLSAEHHQEGVPLRGYVHEIEVRGIGARSLLALLLKLDRDRSDGDVRGVLLRLDSTGMNLSQAQEIREAIAALQAAGKPVFCHLTTANGSEQYACAGADRTFIDPSGYVRLVGPALTSMYYGDALRNLGVRADFVRIGDFKSAVEQYTRGSGSPAATRQRAGLLDDVTERFVHDLASDYETTEANVRGWIDNGPYLADEAESEGWVTRADTNDLSAYLAETMGTAARRRSPRAELADNYGIAQRIGMLVIDGTIVDGDNVDLPLLEIHQSGARTICASIQAMAADPTIRAIVLRVDSPGGSAVASDQIWRAIRAAREQKPVIASMGAMAASGGYYVASAADVIFADPATLTGSIGIFLGKVDFQPLAEAIGVGVHQMQRGRRAGLDSLYRPFSADERATLADKIRRSYGLFLARIHEGRDMPIADIDAVARGRVWSGDAAHALGLVDHLGGTLAAIDEARSRANLRADAQVVVLPWRPSGLLDYVLGPIGAQAAEARSPSDFEAQLNSAGEGRSISMPMRNALEYALTISASPSESPMALLPGHASLRP